MTSNDQVPLLCNDLQHPYLRYLAITFNLQLTRVVPEKTPYLYWSNDKLYMQYAAGQVFVDFTKKNLQYRCQKGGGFSQALAKAIGVKHNEKPKILDATAGLGNDAFILASLGCAVKLLERSPFIAALLSDGFLRAQQHPSAGQILARMALLYIDAYQYLTHTSGRYDVIYLDPMFNSPYKSALSKKGIHALQQTVGKDNDSTALLSLARQSAKKRVVVKRARASLYLNEEVPNYSLQGKTTRFDIYLPYVPRKSKPASN